MGGEADQTKGKPKRTRAQRFEDFFYANRTNLLVFLLLLLSSNVAYWVGSNIANILSGWKGGPWVESTSLAAGIGLAIGTVAIACAAFVQARAASSQAAVAESQLELLKQERDAENALAKAAESQTSAIRDQTLAETRASLSVQFRAVPSQVGQVDEIRALSPGDLLSISDLEHSVFVHNSGPGVATSIEVELRGLASAPQFGGKTVRKWGACGELLGPGESSQVTFPGDVIKELWPGQEVGPKFAIVVWAFGMSLAEGAEADPEQFSTGALGGLIVEQVNQTYTTRVVQAWRVLTEGDCSRLINGEVVPNELPDSVGSSGRRTIRAGAGATAA